MESKQKIGWNVIRTILFIVIGLMNTVFIKAEDVGSFKNYLGYVLLVLGLIDAFFLIRSKVNSAKRS
ncbi:hypothetical protein E4S40_04890 [Algoriphagus kandeliae]|uniref:Uncharacterized protein n=1 Tax=Algoriphagus kandeliae TaxID=2562278 RepID=A0A4Y9QTX1_9BACT|nr:hypothetical protein [Algoriphagus kandeliae]TFV95557.1 hypothetical protein E4S40_04890 [Algoriphagus kandeliae]